MATELDDLIGQRDTAEKSVGSLRVPLMIAVLVVTIGLFVELAVIIVLFSRTQSSLQMAEIIGTGLVVIGVTGELLVEFLRYGREDRLHAANTNLERYYRTTLIDANDTITELKNILAYRTLDDLQKARIMEKLRLLPAQKFSITSHWQTKEVRSFSTLLLSVLISSGWQYSNPPHPTAFPHVLTGLNIVVSAGATPETRSAAQTLIAALLAEDVEVEGPFPALAVERDAIILDFGSKP